PGARGIHTKILHYVEDAIAQWLLARALVFVLPLSQHAAGYAAALDGLVLQGGADISPLAYGEEPQKPEWAGDPMRDRYEIELVRGTGAGYVCAVQWHPEFHGGSSGFLDGGPLLEEFIAAAAS